MQILPFNLLKKDPDVDSIKFGIYIYIYVYIYIYIYLYIVSNFAKETGDYTSLSKVDLRLIALAHTLIKERNEIDIINTNPMTFNVSLYEEYIHYNLLHRIYFLERK